MKRISLSKIKSHNPCADQFKLARKLFGKRQHLAVSVKLALSVADKFDWNWLAQRFLSAPAWKAYSEAVAAAWKAYSEARAPARKECAEAVAAAQKAYDEAMAAAFARAYLSQ